MNFFDEYIKLQAKLLSEEVPIEIQYGATSWVVDENGLPVQSDYLRYIALGSIFLYLRLLKERQNDTN